MKKLCVVAAGVESYSNHKYKCTAKSIILLLVASHDAADGCRRRVLAEKHRRVAVADGGAPARPRARAGLGLLLLLLGLLVLDLLHLQDLGVAADLLAQAVDEAGDVDALADHLQPVLEVAGDPYRPHPARPGGQRHGPSAALGGGHGHLDHDLLLQNSKFFRETKNRSP